ncbi:unnamed protein product [Chrysodeixis includens]|uniref:Uncharacterized protein n=1 Tax=Chrysodeixis includens TaxID=689277 RepID=A0A9P0BMB3_CHRIL|nr:unnamed protein product [Chrysodeixis includens]
MAETLIIRTQKKSIPKYPQANHKYSNINFSLYVIEATRRITFTPHNNIDNIAYRCKIISAVTGTTPCSNRKGLPALNISIRIKQGTNPARAIKIVPILRDTQKQHLLETRQ